MMQNFFLGHLAKADAKCTFTARTKAKKKKPDQTIKLPLALMRKHEILGTNS